jgi:hypothetical protein
MLQCRYLRDGKKMVFYDLVKENGEVISSQDWETMVEPGYTITMGRGADARSFPIGFRATTHHPKSIILASGKGECLVPLTKKTYTNLNPEVCCRPSS